MTRMGTWWVISLLLLGAGACTTPPPAASHGTTAEAALGRLEQGHARFLAGRPAAVRSAVRVAATADSQHPFAAIVGCMDSRTAPELVFDQHIGDVFSIRLAGNVVTPDVLASLEYAVVVTQVPLIVVMGHTGCGAVKGACDDVQLGHLGESLKPLRAAAGMTPVADGPATSANTAWVNAVSRTHVQQTVQQISQQSSVIADQLQQGRVRIAGAIYDVRTGKVDWLALP